MARAVPFFELGSGSGSPAKLSVFLLTKKVKYFAPHEEKVKFFAPHKKLSFCSSRKKLSIFLLTKKVKFFAPHEKLSFCSSRKKLSIFLLTKNS